MLQSTKKALASIQILSMLFSTASLGVAAAGEPSTSVGVTTDTSTVAIPFKDVANHWASREINRWSLKGIIQGYEDATFKPDASISRSEFVSLVNRVFGYPDKANRSFPDVSSSAWYADDVSKAIAAGIVSGDDTGKFRPEAPISRQEAAVILVRAFDLKAKDSKSSTQFTDAAQIASWSKEAVNALLERGYVSGRDSGAFDPLAAITRAEFVKMLDSIVGELKNSANTYSGNVSSNLVVNTKDVNLKNMVIAGDLYITPGVGDGNISMENVTVKGRTIVRGGGEHSIVINKSRLEGQLVVLKQDGKVRIVLQGDSNVPLVQLNSGAKLETDNGTGKGFGDVQVMGTISDDQEIKLDGDFTNVSIEVPGVKVEVTDGTVDKINVLESAIGSSVKVNGGTVNQLNVQTKASIELIGGAVTNVDIQKSAAGSTIQVGEKATVKNFTAGAQVEVTGTGHIENANINADGVKMEPKPTNVKVADGVKTDVTPAAISGGSGSGNNGPVVGQQKTAAEVAATLTSITAPAMDGTALTLPSVPTGFTIAIKSSSDTNVIALDGSIVPPSAATTVNLVLEVTRTSDHSKASSASMAVFVPAKSVNQQTASEVAATLSSIIAPAKDGTVLALPSVPTGFTIAIKSSSDRSVIALDGSIVPPAAATTVNLILEVTRTSDNSKASSASMAVVVPAKSGETVALTDIQLIQPGYNYVSDISGDVISVTSGNTYIYTVDTAEGAGLTTLTVKTVGELLNQITSKSAVPQTYVVKGPSGTKQTTDPIVQGDIVTVSAGQETHDYTVNVINGALRGDIQLLQSQITANTQADVVLNFTAGMRSPAVEVVLKVPKGIHATLDHTSVNVIGRGKVKLSGLATQSVGRTGAGYRFQQVGTVDIADNADGSQFITFKGLDLRPANGADLQITFEGVRADAGSYEFEASYKTAEPAVLTSPWGAVSLHVVNTISDFNRVLEKNATYKESSDTYTKASFNWSAAKDAASVKLMQSTDKGFTWTDSNAVLNAQSNQVQVANLTPNTEYNFKLVTTGGENAGDSNIAKFYTGKYNVKLSGALGNGTADDTQAVNDAIMYLNSLGGGTLLFENGTFNVRTVYLQSNVYLYVNIDATIAALKGGDAPETTYFSDLGYRSGTSATSTGPYKDPENYLTKQDVGHHYFRNTMFFGERLDNIKIIGNGRITGNGNLTTSDGVMNNAANNRSDKMVTVKLCTNFEFGGLDNGLDLWYQETASPSTDQPYYIQSINPDGTNEVKNMDISNMLRVDKAGHFAMLATGTDHINTHDFYYGKDASGSARDVFDYMESSYVTAKNIYVRGSSDDIIKPGSDTALGFTRPATDYYVRNIIGDTNCNLFQIGSETADDIKNAYVDNIYVLAGNKAGFSISTNDGAHVENIYLNYGKTGTVHHKAQMRRTRAPFFISISNRGRTIGGSATRMKWMENGVQRDELLSTNVNIGLVKNIYIKDVNIEQVYQGSQYNDPSKRWQPYNGNATTKATPIIAGYKVGDGGPILPDGRNTGYIENLNFENVDVLVKGGNSFSDTLISPPEMGVGKYNISDIGEQPSYGFWAKHVIGLSFKNVTTNFEKNDDRFAIVLDDVTNATLDGMKMVAGTGNTNVLQVRNSNNITMTNSNYYKNTWGNTLTPLADVNHVTVSGKQTYPNQTIVNLKNADIQLKLAGHTNLTALDTATSTITAILGATVSDIISQVEATNESTQTYAVLDSSNNPKTSGQLVTGDVLVVTSQDGTVTKNYPILVPNVITVEAEDQKNTAITSAGVTLSTSSGTGQSGTGYLQTTALAIGGYVELTINVPVAGTYDLSYQYKTATSGRATAQVSLDGTNMGAPTNQIGAIANVFTPVDLGNVTLTAGNHAVRFTATAAGSVVVDYVRLTGVTSVPTPSTNTNIQLAASHPDVSAIDTTALTVHTEAGTTVADIVAQIKSVDGSAQVYTVTDSNNIVKSSGVLVTNDKLIVTAENTTSQVTYIISVAAILTNNSNVDLQLSASASTVIAVNNLTRRISISGTTTTVTTLPSQLSSTNGTVQTYAITNATGGAPKTNAVNGDKVFVTAADGTTTATYLIAIGASASSTYVQVNAAGHPHVVTVYNSDRSIIAKTGLSAANLLAEMESSDALTQTYTVTDAVYVNKTGNTLLQTGDLLKITSQNGSTSAYYTINIVDEVYDIDPLGTYTTSNNNAKTTGADDTAGNHDRNSAVNYTHMQVNLAANQYIEFTIIASVDGTYNVLFGSKKSNSARATMQLTVDGMNVGSVNELVATSALQGMYLSHVGSVTLSAGSHTFRFTVAAAATGQSFDFIGLSKTN